MNKIGDLCFQLLGSNKYPLLNKQEEVELAEKIKKGDKEALERMVLSNLRLVKKIAGRFVGRGVLYQDLVIEGSIGLLRAAKKFKPEKGCRFSTFATFWIEQVISRSISETGRTIRIPIHMLDAMTKASRAIALLKKEGKEVTPDKIANLSGMKKHLVLKCIRLIEQGIAISLDAPIGGQDDRHTLTLLQKLRDDKTPNPLKIQEEREAKDGIKKLLAILNDQEISVLNLRFGLNGQECTLQEIADIYGLTRERIRQIEATALRKMRAKAERTKIKFNNFY